MVDSPVICAMEGCTDVAGGDVFCEHPQVCCDCRDELGDTYSPSVPLADQGLRQCRDCDGFLFPSFADFGDSDLGYQCSDCFLALDGQGYN